MSCPYQSPFFKFPLLYLVAEKGIAAHRCVISSIHLFGHQSVPHIFALSPLLFNIVLEKIVREINLCEGVELGQSKINILAYADDIAPLGKNKEMMIQMGKSLIKT